MIFMIIIHMIICLALIGIVLIQRGRGSGLVESFAGVESMFGTKTSEFLTRATTVLSTSFFISCLILTVLSIKQSKSLMQKVRPEEKKPMQVPVKQERPQEAPKTQQEAPKTQQEAPKAEK